jgi:hypothetical protein
MKSVVVTALGIVTVVAGGLGLVGRGQAPPADPARAIEFRQQRIDDGQSEAAALADLNGDGALDIISSESWYEAPRWTKHPLRTIPFTNNYVDNFSDLPVDVNGDGRTDLVQIGYFARRIIWIENPGTTGGVWTEHEIDAVGPTEFAFLVDINNDGRAMELLPQFTSAQAPLCWYEIQDGKWVKHVVSAQSYGHGIGAGDLNGDGRTDIVTPQGWLEAPADVRAAGHWTFHATDWLDPRIPIGRPPAPLDAAPAGDSAAAPVPPGAGSAPDPTRPVDIDIPPPGVPPVARGRGATPASRGRGTAPVRVEYGFMHVIDLNEDGRHDVLTTMAHSFGVLWFEQGAGGTWTQHLIDNTWSRGHASALADVNGDGRRDFVTGTRFMGRNTAETEPLAMYWYEYRPGPEVTWIRHRISAGGQAGGGLQTVVGDVGGDGDADIVSGGKSGLFLFEQ